MSSNLGNSDTNRSTPDMSGGGSTTAINVRPEQDALIKDAGEKEKPVIPTSDAPTIPFSQACTLAGIYMGGCITFFLLIRLSKKRGVSYDDAAAVFFTEAIKWFFSVGAMFYRTGKFLPVTVFQDKSWKVGIYYAVPSAIYAVYNNLTYYNLKWFDPGTYQVFMQTRVLFTGILFTWILKKLLTRRKWISLLLLTAGVMAKNFSGVTINDWRVCFMLFQASLSAFAGVYNEYLLKDQPSMDVNEANFFMYTFALLFNLSYGLYNNSAYYTGGEVFENLNGIFLLIVINGAVIGIVTSLLLKYLNVIIKAFCSAGEVLLTAIIAAFLLGDPMGYKDVLASIMVMYSIYIYYGTGPVIPFTKITIAEPPESNRK